MAKIALTLLLVLCYYYYWTLDGRLLSTASASTFNFGLRSKDNQPLQLLDLKTKATIEGPYASIEYTHTYSNPYNQPLETEFYFPRTDNSVFHKFEAIFQNQTIVGQVLEKTQAKEMYEWNVQRGNTVAYSERNALVPDVMQILVGNIPAGEKVDIRFSVIQPLEVVVNQFWGFTLPSVLTERYTPSSVDPSQVPNVVNVGLENSMYKEWKVLVEIKSDTPFEYIANPSHKIRPQYANNPSSGVYKAFWDVTIVPNKDFVVYFRAEKLEVPSVIKATHPQYPNDHVMLVNFVPQLNTLDAQDSQQKLENNEEGFLELKKLALEEDIKHAKGEFIFVIDRSGSMQGDRIENLKKALIRFFQVLPKDSFFNIVSFGSSHSLYEPESVRYTPQAVHDIMLNWIPYVQADMGGTEILTAIQLASSLPMMSGYPRTIMLLTDGGVHNPDQVVNHALTHSEKMRFCSVGIGYGASEYLVKNFAKAGKCTSVLVQENEDIGDKAIYMVKAAISRYLENIDFSVTCFDTSEKEIFKQTEKVGMLLKDLAFKQWVYLQDIQNLGSCKVKLEYYNSLKEEQFREEIDIRGFQTAEVTDLWHKVAYDAKIREMDLIVKSNRDSYQNIQDLKVKIEKLAVKYQVLSDYTAFLAVIQESVQNTQGGDRLKVTIPNLDSADHCAESAEMASGGSSYYESAKVNAAPPSAARYAASSGDSFSHKMAYKVPSSTGSAQRMYAQVDQSASYSSASGGSYYYQGADWLMTRALMFVLCFIFIMFFVL